MVDRSNATECVKTGGQGFLIEYDEYIYGDWFKTKDGALICNAVYRGRGPVRPTVNYHISEISLWAEHPDKAMHGVLVVDSDAYFDRGYEGDPIS